MTERRRTLPNGKESEIQRQLLLLQKVRLALTVVVLFAVAVIAVLNIIALVAHAEATRYSLRVNQNSIQILEECTTPSTKTETHECFEESEARTARAIARILDADGNGKVDITEIKELLERLEAR